MKSSEISRLSLLIARGIPGSGKSYKVNEICNSLTAAHRHFIVCSSDHYFIENEVYKFNINKLGQAHKYCQELCELYLDRGCDVVIIDNTNVSAKECRIYVEMGLRYDYRIEFLEPSTPWAFDLDELEKRNQHNVPRHALESMLRRWVPDMTVEKALGHQQESKNKHKDEEAAEEAWETKKPVSIKNMNLLQQSAWENWLSYETRFQSNRKKKDDYNEQAG